MQPETHRNSSNPRSSSASIRRAYHHVGFGGGAWAVNKLKVNEAAN